MNKTDIEIWYRVYLPDGGDTDKRYRPLEYRSAQEFFDTLQEDFEAIGFVDYDIVSYDYVSSNDAWGISQKEEVWDAWNDFFDMAKEYGVNPQNLFKVYDNWGYEMVEFRDYMENAYMGEADNLEDAAYDLLESTGGPTEEQARNYFDYASFGRTLESEGFVWNMTMEDWEDRYDTELEAQAAYDELERLSPQELAEYYIYDVVGSLQDALSADQISNYFDYKSFARDMGYEGWDVIGGIVLAPY